MSSPPIKLRKAQLVVGKTLNFRNADVADAAYILCLRTNSEKSRYLSAVSENLADQQAWLAGYKKSDDQAYFIIEYKGEQIGTVRLYNPEGDSFCWGSWILASTCPKHVAIESALMVYAYAIDHLGFKSAHFNVRKGNERVWQFHERFGARRVSEDQDDYQYRLDGEAIRKSRQRYQRYLDSTVNVKFY